MLPAVTVVNPGCNLCSGEDKTQPKITQKMTTIPSSSDHTVKSSDHDGGTQPDHPLRTPNKGQFIKTALAHS